jgi:hypothetical protein
MRHDLPRNSQLVALAADPRNDENLVVSQLHLALLRFHNAVVGDVKDDLGPGFTVDEIFAEAQRTVRWHYQWLLVHEFLPATVGQDVVDDVLENGLEHYKWRNDPFIPVEFSVAAYRFGHSRVRPSYRANFGTSASDPALQFFALLFDPAATNPADPADLRGGRRAPRRVIDWRDLLRLRRRTSSVQQEDRHHAFDGPVRPDGLAPGNGHLVGEPQSAAQPHHEGAIGPACRAGHETARAGDLTDLKDLSLHQRTPLWFYILREAAVTADGEHLGLVGGRIVAEVILGLIQGDRQSYLSQDPDWTPTYGTGDNFGMVDLLSVAGVVATIS